MCRNNENSNDRGGKRETYIIAPSNGSTFGAGGAVTMTGVVLRRARLAVKVRDTVLDARGEGTVFASVAVDGEFCGRRVETNVARERIALGNLSVVLLMLHRKHQDVLPQRKPECWQRC